LGDTAAAHIAVTVRIN